MFDFWKLNFLQQFFSIKMMNHRLIFLGIMLLYVTQSRLSESSQIDIENPLFWLYTILCIFLSLFAGFFSGLTAGYMAINKSEMELWLSSGNEEERKIAKPILQILTNHYELIATLVLSNALCSQALPIFLNKLVPEYLAIILSITVIVLFGQIFPQAFCTGHHKVKIAYYTTGLIKILKVVLYIFIKPIVYVLNNWIGRNEQKLTLNKENIKAILYLHNSRQYGYRPEEIQILQNTIDLRAKFVKNYMIRLQNVFLASQETLVDQKFIQKLEQVNFSKVPVYSGNKQNIFGYFKVRNIIAFTLQEKKNLKDHKVISPIVHIYQNLTLLQAIQILRVNKTNFGAVIHHEDKKCLGIITLKQIFENLVLKEFNDNDLRINLDFGQKEKGVMGELKQGKQQH